MRYKIVWYQFSVFVYRLINGSYFVSYYYDWTVVCSIYSCHHYSYHQELKYFSVAIINSSKHRYKQYKAPFGSWAMWNMSHSGCGLDAFDFILCCICIPHPLSVAYLGPTINFSRYALPLVQYIAVLNQNQITKREYTSLYCAMTYLNHDRLQA